MTITNAALDAALTAALLSTDRLDICSVEPSTYTEATATFSIGYKTGITWGALADRLPDGRQAEIDPITNGVVTSNAVATHWALSVVGTTTLVATGPLLTNYTVAIATPFDIPSFIFGATST